MNGGCGSGEYVVILCKSTHGKDPFHPHPSLSLILFIKLMVATVWVQRDLPRTMGPFNSQAPSNPQ